jgi:DNA-binding GntR family transcriptional regulator
VILQQMFGSIEARIHTLRRVSLRAPGREEQSRHECEEVVRWILAGDATKAAGAAKAHVMAAKIAALTAIREMNGAAAT